MKLAGYLRRWRRDRRLRRTRVLLIDALCAIDSATNRLDPPGSTPLISMRDDFRRQIAEIDRLLGEP